jgi:hypothetical protein
MMSLMKAPIKGVLVAGVVAVLPTLIVAHLAAPADRPKIDGKNIAPDFSEPATRPSHFDGEGSGPGAGGGGGGMGGGLGEGHNHAGPGGRRLEQASPEEIQAAIDFFKANSPNRMAYFAKLQPDGQPRRRQSLMLVQYYRPIANFKESNPKLYDLLVKQVKLRDDAFELAKDGKEAELRDKAAQIVDVSLEARSKRLALLQQELTNQQTQLADDEANKDAVTEREVNTIKEDERRLVSRAQHQSMLDFDPSTDPLAEAAPIRGGPAKLGG